MREKINIAVDAMGGDNAPAGIVKGCMTALAENADIKIILLGDSDAISECLGGAEFPQERLEIIHTSEIIETAEPPVAAIKRKKDSSMVVGLRLVKEGKADAFLSAGSSGAILAGGLAIVGRLKGVKRAPLAPLIPTETGASLLIDCGANVDARAEHLVQFAKIGSIYMENVVGVKKPKVAIVNIGAEEEKGNALVKETYPLLEACEEINFIGNIEARDIPKGGADVIVCEAFVGNVILKLYEGVASTLLKVLKEGLLSSTKSKLGAALSKDAMKSTLKRFDASSYGGAPLLGLKGLVVKVHGSSTEKEVKTGILQCAAFKRQDINGKISEAILEDSEGSAAEGN